MSDVQFGMTIEGGKIVWSIEDPKTNEKLYTVYIEPEHAKRITDTLISLARQIEEEPNETV
jgi:hypothetical protein